MHIQRHRIHDIARRAHDAGKVVALGGPSVSSAPEYYPEVDLLHCGEAGDATLRLFERIDETVERPEEQIVYRTVERLPMSDFPTPAYNRINIRDYLLGSVQFSSGCPYTCEFCDIPVALRPQSAAENAGAGRGANSTSLPTAAAFRSISSTTISSAIPKRRRACSTR